MGIPSYSSNMTRDIAKSKGLPQTTEGFSDSLIINFDNKAIELYYYGAAHTMDNIVAGIPSESILYASCMIKTLSQNNLGFTGDGDLHEYPRTLKKIHNKFQNAKYVIPGHGKFGGYDLVKHTLEISLKLNQ
ncbi:MAG: hypothetical protein C0597_09280 [Marinilabiliales bacterium]|nr:MAG: hypothetical protein C0597_09280 [Marinilabiliales bacterium]